MRVTLVISMSFCDPPRAKPWPPPQCSLARVPMSPPLKKILDPPRLSDDQKLSSTSVPDRAVQRNVDHCRTCGLQTWSYINLPQQTFHGASDQLISSGKFSHYFFQHYINSIFFRQHFVYRQNDVMRDVSDVRRA